MKRALAGLAAGALLLIFWLQMVLALPRLSATTDEVVHLPAGYTYWTTRDFRLNPEHPPLAKLFAAIPLLALKPRLDLSWPEWNSPQQYIFGYGFLYTNDADRLLFWGRLPMTLLATLCGFIVFLWAAKMHGYASGTFCARTVRVFSKFAGSWDACHHGRSGRGVHDPWRCICFGRRSSAHHCCVSWRWIGHRRSHELQVFRTILPIVLIAFCVARIFAARDRRKQAIAEVRFLAIAGVSALMVIEATYLFSVWPWTYFANMRSVNANHNPDHLFYLFGSFSRTGWWYYFPLAFAVKATIPLLLATTLALVHFFIKRFNDVWGETIILVTIVVYVGVMTMGADDLGVRYLLPIFPLLFVWCSRIVLDLNNDARAWRCSFFL